MKALLLKDFYILKSRNTLVILLLFFLTFRSVSVILMLALAAMLPVTSIAYDERSKWDAYCATLPFGVGEIVLSKYTLGYIAVSLLTLLTIATEFLLSILFSRALDTVLIYFTILGMFAAGLILALYLPVVLKYGTEKGRLVMFVTFAALGVLVDYLSDSNLTIYMLSLGSVLTLLFSALIFFIVFIVSFRISLNIYSEKYH